MKDGICKCCKGAISSLFILCCVIIYCSGPKDAGGIEPSGFLSKVEDGTATLGDWERASDPERRKFAAQFVENYAGKRDPRDEHDIIQFLTITISEIRERMPAQAETLIKSSRLDTNAHTGARLMEFQKKTNE
ncbi:MAG: hypothetical protein Q7S42_02420 [Candidatus Omnitrophota bacterium]|nr:hypothetical protein [Candidatus Omnitrophota bacterium]